ncbi:MAG: nuclear transport factor 2 family protein [Rhodospirillaceae bacterium]|nr:nuclear transport factor 2 family protein [Rhodospirillaceae bacterium]MDD9928680.1 nuclear transport factor 2 family protein [Rhodospirillaceae bacterium]
MASQITDDKRAIEALIRRQFESLQWAPDRAGDWDGFTADFHPEATLYAKARPAVPQSVDVFVDRMKGLADSSLSRFDERFLGTRIEVFGNVAIAFSGCEFTENGQDVSRGVEAMLLVKQDSEWKIVSQAWDMESPGNPLPATFSGA